MQNESRNNPAASVSPAPPRIGPPPLAWPVSGHVRDVEIAALRQQIAELRTELCAESSHAPAQPLAAVDDKSMAILRAIEKAFPCLQKQYEIEAATSISRRTISAKMPMLLYYGLVARPQGQRKGISITETGLRLLKTK